MISEKHSVTGQPLLDSVAGPATAYDLKVTEFLNSKTLEEFTEKAKPIVSDIVWAVCNSEETPHQVLGMNMLHWAVMAGDKDALSRIFMHIPHNEIVSMINGKNGARPGDDVFYEASGIRCPAINEDTPLGLALDLASKVKGYNGIAWQMMKALKAGELQDAINNTGHNLLNLAGGCKLPEFRKLCSLFKDNHARFSELINHTTHNMSTPLHHAARIGNMEVFSYLLEAGAVKSLLVIDAGGNTPVDYLEKHNEKHNKDVNRQDSQENSASCLFKKEKIENVIREIDTQINKGVFSDETKKIIQQVRERQLAQLNEMLSDTAEQLMEAASQSAVFV